MSCSDSATLKTCNSGILTKKTKFERMIKSGGTNYITTLNSSIFRDILKEFLSNKIMLQKTDEMSEPSTKIAKCDSVSE